MVNQMRIGAGVIGALLVLFLAILYVRLVGGGQSPPMHIKSAPPVTRPVDTRPTVSRQPTIVTSDEPLDFPPVPPPPPPPDPYPSGPNPGALIPEASPAPEFEARRD